MKIVITGSNGFIGKNLMLRLNELGHEPFGYDLGDCYETLMEKISEADIVYNLAGINRPKENVEFEENYTFLETLLSNVTKKTTKIILTSSIHAENDSDYGKSKRIAEETLINFSKEKGNSVYCFRLPNVFGKWCRPNYNSAIATFCNNIANDLEITVNNYETIMTLVYIDDVINSFIDVINDNSNEFFYEVPVTYSKTLKEITDLIYSFSKEDEHALVPTTSDTFAKKLHATYLTYLPKEKISTKLFTNVDERGSFTELFKNKDAGQVSVSVTKPGEKIIRGNHYHHTKNEKFVVISGEATISEQNIWNDEIYEFKVSGDEPKIVNMIPGMTHNIINTGQNDMILIIWSNEIFDKAKPDTIYKEIKCKK